jgi:hypothetical protein
LSGLQAERGESAIPKLKPRAGIRRTIWSIDNGQPEHVSIERESGIGVVYDKCDVMNASTTRFQHQCIMPVASLPRHPSLPDNGWPLSCSIGSQSRGSGTLCIGSSTLLVSGTVFLT